jgi:hypothetical protein
VAALHDEPAAQALAAQTIWQLDPAQLTFRLQEFRPLQRTTLALA